MQTSPKNVDVKEGQLLNMNLKAESGWSHPLALHRVYIIDGWTPKEDLSNTRHNFCKMQGRDGENTHAPHMKTNPSPQPAPTAEIFGSNGPGKLHQSVKLKST
jgi:hypothetical protein